MTRRETRTKAQIDANAIDLKLFNAAEALDYAAGQLRQPVFYEHARTIRGMRWAVRKLMHPKDREATQ